MSSLRKGKGKRTGKPESSNGMIKIGSRANSLGAATGSKSPNYKKPMLYKFYLSFKQMEVFLNIKKYLIFGMGCL